MSNDDLILFVEPSTAISNKCIISPNNAQSLGIPNGGNVTLVDQDTNKNKVVSATPNEEVLDFSIKIANDVLTEMGFGGVEIKVLPTPSGSAPSQAPVPTSQPNAPSPAPSPQPS